MFAEVSNCEVGICFPRSDEFLPVQLNSDTFGDKFKVQKSRKHAHQAQMYNISDDWNKSEPDELSKYRRNGVKTLMYVSDMTRSFEIKLSFEL